MKSKGVTRLLKQMVEALASVTKAKFLTQSLKTRMTDIKTRVTIFSLLYLDKRSLLGSIRSNKLRSGSAFVSHHRKLKQEPNGGEDMYQISNQADEILQDQYQCINQHGDATVVVNHVGTEFVEETSYGFHQEDGEENNDDVEEDKKYFAEDDLARSQLEELDFKDHEEGISAMEFVNDFKEKEEDCFRLEDQIDEVAELFIRRFHQQMRMQKQNSFKRSYQEIISS